MVYIPSIEVTYLSNEFVYPYPKKDYFGSNNRKKNKKIRRNKKKNV